LSFCRFSRAFFSSTQAKTCKEYPCAGRAFLSSAEVFNGDLEVFGSSIASGFEEGAAAEGVEVGAVAGEGGKTPGPLIEDVVVPGATGKVEGFGNSLA